MKQIPSVRPSLKNKIKGPRASTWTNPNRQVCLQAKTMATKVPASADPATKALPTENAEEGEGGGSLTEGEGADEGAGGAGGDVGEPGDSAEGDAADEGEEAGAGVGAVGVGAGVGAGGGEDGGGVAGAVGAGTGAAAGGGGGVVVGGCVGAPPGACAMQEVARSPKMRNNCTAEEPMF